MILSGAVSGVPARAEAPAAGDFSSRWLVSPVQSAPAKDGQGKLEVRVLERIVRMSRDVEFPVGTIVYFKFPKPRRQGAVLPFDPADVAEKMRYSLGLPGWRARRQEKAFVYEANWTAANRFVRLYLLEEGDSITYTVATFRPAFETLFVETEMLQRQLMNVADETIPWLRDMTALLDGAEAVFVPAAEAAPPSGIPGLPGGIPGLPGGIPGLPGTGGTSPGGTAACCPPAGTTCAPTNYACWANVACCTQSSLGDKYSGPLNAANSQLAGINNNLTGFNQNWSDTNREARRANNLLASFLDPGHAALWAGATAFGAMAGAMVFNLLIDGVVEGAKAIYELITHEQEDKDIMENYKKAREIWVDVSRVTNELEKSIDDLIDLKEISKKFNLTREQTLQGVAPLIALKKAEADNADVLLRAAAQPGSGYSEACKLELAAKSSSLHDLSQDLGKLKDYLQAPGKDAEICDNLVKKLSKLAAAQGQLQRARDAILVADAKGLWQKELGNEYDKSRENWKKIREGALTSWRASVKLADDQKEKGIKEMNAHFNQWLETCMKGKVGFIGEVLLLGGIRYFWTSACKDEFTASGGTAKYWKERKLLEKSCDDTKRAADDAYWGKVKYKDELHVKNPLLDSEQREYIRFFRELTEEQACLFTAEACPPAASGTKISKFDALTAKKTRIEEVCKKSGI